MLHLCAHTDATYLLFLKHKMKVQNKYQYLYFIMTFISVLYRVIIHTNRNSELCCYIYYNRNTREWFESVGYTQSEPFVHISVFIIL
jgi:hypothetical protein